MSNSFSLRKKNPGWVSVFERLDIFPSPSSYKLQSLILWFLFLNNIFYFFLRPFYVCFSGSEKVMYPFNFDKMEVSNVVGPKIQNIQMLACILKSLYLFNWAWNLLGSDNVSMVSNSSYNYYTGQGIFFTFYYIVFI